MKMKESHERTHTYNKTIKAKKLWWGENRSWVWTSTQVWVGGLLSKLGREGRGCFYIVSATHDSRVLGGVQYSYTHIFKGSVAYPRLKHWHNTLCHQLTCKDFSRNTHNLFSLVPLWIWAVFCSRLAAAAAVHPMCLLFRDCVKSVKKNHFKSYMIASYISCWKCCSQTLHDVMIFAHKTVLVGFDILLLLA